MRLFCQLLFQRKDLKLFSLSCDAVQTLPQMLLSYPPLTWSSRAGGTGGRSAEVLSSGSGCRTSSCPEPESGWPRRACSPSQLG